MGNQLFFASLEYVNRILQNSTMYTMCTLFATDKTRWPNINPTHGQRVKERAARELREINQGRNKDTSLEKPTQYQPGSDPGRMHDWRGSQALYQSATSPYLVAHVSRLLDFNLRSDLKSNAGPSFTTLAQHQTNIDYHLFSKHDSSSPKKIHIRYQFLRAKGLICINCKCLVSN